MTRVVLVALLLTGCAAAVQGPPADTLVDGRAGTIAFRTMTLTPGQTLRGERGDDAVITGELAPPPGAPARLHAVVLMHGAADVQDYHYQWARELRSIGFATFIVDSFSGRGIGRIVENLEAINPGSRVLDTYRAPELLATHPRIDRQRVVLTTTVAGGR